MNRIRLLTALSLALLAALGVHAQGLIWSVNQLEGNTIAAPGGGFPSGSWQIAFDHTPENVGYPPSMNPMSGIFSMSLATNDSGRTFFANTLNEAGFAGFVSGLTDGTNGFLRFQVGAPHSWRAGSEQLFLGRSAVAPDLAGYTITQIGFRVNSFYDYFDVQEDRYFKQLDYSLDFYGSPVPEPGSWALLTLGGAALLLWRKARRRG